MPTDQELITSFVNLSADAKEVLNKLLEFATENKEVTFNLSGGTFITVDSINKMIARFENEWDILNLDFEKNFGGVYNSSITRDSYGYISSGTITFMSGDYLEITNNRDSSGLLTSIDWELKDSEDNTLASGSKTIERDSNGNIIKIE